MSSFPEENGSSDTDTEYQQVEEIGSEDGEIDEEEYRTTHQNYEMGGDDDGDDNGEYPKELFIVYGEEMVTLRARPSTTIMDIKSKLAEEYSVPIHHQRLSVNGHVIGNDDNNNTIDEYDLEDKERLEVILKVDEDYSGSASDGSDDDDNITRPFSAQHGTVFDSYNNEPSNATEEYSQPRVMYGPSYITNHMPGAGSTSSTHYMSDNDEDDGRVVPRKRANTGLVGLKNQGATCYLNSLIQVLYLTPEFRRMIFHFDRPWDKLLEDDTTTQEKKSEDKPEAKPEAKPEEKNGESNGTVATTTTEEKPDKKRDIIFQMQMLFARMQYDNASSVSTSGLTTSFGWDNSDIFVQHDVQELNRVLCDKLEEKMKGKQKEGDHSIASLYRGIMVNMIKCMNCGRVSTREEDFYDVSLVIKGKKNIIESLDEFTEVEVMEGDNAYSCEKCASKQTAHKSIKFKNLPTILNLQLKRFEYDWENNQRVKLNDDIKFPPYLHMEKYLVDEEVAAQLRHQEETTGTATTTTSSTTTSDQLATQNDKEPAKPQQKEDPLDKSTLYELYGILVHSGSAGFGHYYAFIKNFADGKWYKFNDDNVTFVSDSDISEQNWLGSSNTSTERPFSWIHSPVVSRSATPYMLVYRKREPSTVGGDSSPMNIEDDPHFNRHSYQPFVIPPIDDQEIPKPVLEFLTQDIEKREERRRQKEKEANTVTMTIYRNRLELPTFEVKLDKHATLDQLLKEVVDIVSKETPDTKYFYRFRRVASRKNATRRATSQVYQGADLQRSLLDLGLDKKNWIYLEQDTDETYPGVGGETPDDHAFISIRLWDHQLSHPVSLKDIVVPKSTTIMELKQKLVNTLLPQFNAEQLLLVEEETEKVVNKMVNENDTLSKCSIVSGDILHVEPLVPQHFDKESGKIIFSFVADYYAEKHNELTLEVEESQTSFKRRTGGKKDAAAEEENAAAATPASKWKTNKISLKVLTNKNHTLAQFKNLVLANIDDPNIINEPRRIRIYAKDTPGFGEGRLLKDLEGKLSTLLTRYGGSRVSTDLALEILDQPEDLRKGDKLINTRYHNATGDFVCFIEVRINKTETIRDMKTKLREKTGVPEELQVISEWYNDHFYKLFPNENDTIASARIRKTDILRMDELTDPKMNITNNLNNPPEPILALQLVQFIGWETTAYGRKEMHTSFPILFTVPETLTLYELRLALAAKVGVPYYNINVALASHFPVLEGYITPIKDLVTKFGENEEQVPTATPIETEPTTTTATTDQPSNGEVTDNNVATTTITVTADTPAASTDTDTVMTDRLPTEDENDPDVKANELAKEQNQSGRQFNFKGERTVTLRKSRFRLLDVICWEDLRNTKAQEKPESGRNTTKSKKSYDGDVLKIKN